MNKLYLLVIISLSSLCASAQDLKDFYIQAVHPDGMLYFVTPPKMAVARQAKDFCTKSLLYDYTYLDSSDSVRMLMTVTTKQVFKADSLDISFADGSTRRYATEIIYVSPQKRAWESRVECNITEKDWEKMYQGIKPFSITLLSDESTAKPVYSEKPSKWKKLAAKFLRLQEMIKLNK